MIHPLQLPIKNKFLYSLVAKCIRLDAIKEIYDDWLENGDKSSINQGVALLDFSLRHMNISINWQYAGQRWESRIVRS